MSLNYQKIYNFSDIITILNDLLGLFTLQHEHVFTFEQLSTFFHHMLTHQSTWNYLIMYSNISLQQIHGRNSGFDTSVILHPSAVAFNYY